VFTPEDYELVDFGEGRRLERFQGSLSIAHVRPQTACLRSAPLRLGRSRHAVRAKRRRQGKWRRMQRCPEGWSIRHRWMQLELRPTPLGQVGVFPEQAENWDWIEAQIRRAGRPLRVLNMFAYTGGATLAAAAAGARSSIWTRPRRWSAWARRNAGLSNLSGATIRWIVEDAVEIRGTRSAPGQPVRRPDSRSAELRSWPEGGSLEDERHLGDLLSRCAALTGPPRVHSAFLHSPVSGPAA